MPDHKERFATYLLQRQEVMGLTLAAIGAGIGCSGPNFGKWLSENTFGRDCVPALAAVFHLDGIQTPEDVEAQWEVKWKRVYHSKKATADASDLARAVTAIDQTLHPAFVAMRKAAALTREVFSHMGEGDFLIGTTVSVVPLLYRNPTSDEDARDYFESRVGAVRRGALFAMLMPSKACLQRIAEYHFAELVKHEELTSGWADFHQKLCERIQQEDGISRAKDARQIAHTRAQCFLCDDLPLTGLGWTVSVLGLRTSAQHKAFRVLVRSRLPDPGSFLLLPPAQHGIEQWMRQFASATLDNAEDEAVKKKDQESRWRVEFIRDLRARMRP